MPYRPISGFAFVCASIWVASATWAETPPEAPKTESRNASSFEPTEPTPIGRGNEHIWVIPSLSAPSVKNGGKLTIQSLVKAAAGVREVRAEILDGERVLDTLTLAPSGSRVGGVGSIAGAGGMEDAGLAGPTLGVAQFGIWQAEWIATGLEEKFYIIRLTATDGQGRSFKDESLRFSDPVAGITTPGTTEYPDGGMRRVGAHFDGDESQVRCAVLDASTGYAYFGTYTSPGRVVKVALGAGSAAPTRVGALSLPAGEDYLQSGVFDAVDGYAYFAARAVSSRVVKVQVSQSGLLKGTNLALPEPANVTSASFYSHSATGNVRLAIYDDAPPRNLLWEGGPFANSATNDWLTVPISTGIPSSLALAPGSYKLAWQIDTHADVPSYAPGNVGDGFYVPRQFGEVPPQLDPLSPMTTDETWSAYITYDTPTPTPTPCPAIGSAENGEFVEDSIPATMAIGQTLNVGLTWRNTGDGVWSSLCLDHALAVTLDDCGVAGGAGARVPMLVDGAAGPGEFHQFIAQLTAPNQSGDCVIRWRMSRGVGGNFVAFGPEIETSIQVVVPPNSARDWEVYE